MSYEDKVAAKVEAIRPAFQAVADRAFEAGRAEGYAAGRADFAAIAGSAEARGRETFARELASDPSMTVERALKILAVSQRVTVETAADSYRALLKAHAPVVQHHAVEVDQRSVRARELSAIGSNVRRH